MRNAKRVSVLGLRIVIVVSSSNASLSEPRVQSSEDRLAEFRK